MPELQAALVKLVHKSLDSGFRNRFQLPDFVSRSCSCCIDMANNPPPIDLEFPAIMQQSGTAGNGGIRA